MVSFEGLHRDASQWRSHIDPSINPKASLAFEASNLPDGSLLVTNIGNVPYAGGLVSRSFQVPQMMGAGQPLSYCQFVKFGATVMLPAMTAKNIARLEFDWIEVLMSGAGLAADAAPPPNRINLSTQLNLDTGLFEIDASPGKAHWSPIGTGAAGGPGKSPSPDAPHEIAVTGCFDVAAKTRSVLGISWDGAPYAVPKELQNVGWQPSTEGVGSRLQLQNEMFKPWVAQVVYTDVWVQHDTQPF